MTVELTQANKQIPFLNLNLVHSAIKEQILEDVSELLDSSAFTNGPAVGAFEAEFADYCGVDYCVGLASGLDALRLALLAGGIEKGDEVIVPANTFVATLEAVTQAGAIPVPVDVTEQDYNIDVAAVRAAIGPRTRYLMPVHLYGQLADMSELLAIAGNNQLAIIEDACQAHGAERDGIRPGVHTLAAAFSFYPGKNLGAIGDAGALVSNDEGLCSRVQSLREHGQQAKYVHEFEGYTARLDTIQASVLSRKLPSLNGWNQQRQDIAERYSEELANVGDLTLPPVAENSKSVWHLYVIRTDNPSALADYLKDRGIATGRHYPQPVHLTTAYRWLGYKEGSFPVTERIASELLSLPIFPGMTESQLEIVTSTIKKYFDSQ